MKTFVVVTGASSGMGSDFARQLDSLLQPDEVWLVARREDRLSALAAELRPGVGRVVASDLATAGGTESLAREIETACSQGDRLLALVNNAGFGTYGPSVDTDIQWQLSMVDVNIRALTHLSWLAGRCMDKGGVLINVASLAAFFPLANFAAYAATKAYVLSFTTALGAELEGKGIKVMSLCPGPVATEFSEVASRGARSFVHGGKPSPKVVAHCLHRAYKGRALALQGIDWKCAAFFSRFLGRRLVSRLTWRFMKRPQAGADPS